jgi:hypothetical protein
MIRIKIPAIRAIKGDNEMPKAKDDNAITIGEFSERLVKEARHAWIAGHRLKSNVAR